MRLVGLIGSDHQGTHSAGLVGLVGSDRQGAQSAVEKGHSFRVLEPWRSACLLAGIVSTVTQAKLDELGLHFHIPLSISMRAPEMGEFPLHPFQESGEIAFPVAVLECGVRLPLASFLQRALSEFPLHPLQVVPAL